VPPTTDPEQLSGYVMAVHAGMAMRARDGGTSEEVLAIADTGLRAIALDAQHSR